MRQARRTYRRKRISPVKKIYLAGPITGVSWGGSEDWRDELKRLVAWDTQNGGRRKYAGFQLYSPLRGKDYLRGESSIKDTYEQFPLSTAKAVMLRDSYDVRTADAVIVNLMGATRVSIGTVMEVAWAYERNIPIIAIMEPPVSQEVGSTASQGNIHEHAMLNEAIWWRVQTLEAALDVLSLLFNP
jgi:nucleoside 2-deoxyribosyltransferase